MSIAIYPGSFDPVTYGHLDVIRRASLITDRLIVGVLNNPSKNTLFTVEERVELLKQAVSGIENVEIRSFSGLTVDFARLCGANVIVRGLRAVTDFEYELMLSQTNRKLCPDVDTIFLTTSLQYAYLSSSVVKEVAMYNGNISEFVPEFVEKQIKDKMSQRGE